MEWDRERQPSIVGMADYGMRCVARMAEKWRLAGDATLDFVGFNGADDPLPDNNFVILAGSIGDGLAALLAGHTRQRFRTPGNSSFVMAVVAVPFADDLPDIDVQRELDGIKHYADMVCVVFYDEWAAHLGTSKMVAAHCEREVELCISAFIHGVVEVGHIGLDLNDVDCMFGAKGNVAFGRCRIAVAGDAGDESIRQALKDAGMARTIVGAESVLVCFTGHPGSLKGRHVKAVREELGRHINPDASIAFGMQYDSRMPQETFQFDIWACGSASAN